jgi:2-amino-4-hydroxy-6-hydroxymethyldihydropteridine diphosphokinase
LKNNGYYDVTISLATNFEQERNLSEAHERLRQILFETRYTNAIWTEPYKSKLSAKYINQLVYAKTTLNAEELISVMKAIETSMGRTAQQREKGIVTIDLDLMEHDGVRYHLEDWQRPYIKMLLESEIV